MHNGCIINAIPLALIHFSDTFYLVVLKHSFLIPLISPPPTPKPGYKRHPFISPPKTPYEVINISPEWNFTVSDSLVDGANTS